MFLQLSVVRHWRLRMIAGFLRASLRLNYLLQAAIWWQQCICLHHSPVFVYTVLLYLSALLSCIYCSSVAFRALLSRLPDGGNLITSLYPQPHSASFDSSGWQYFYILLNVSGRMDQVSTVEKGSKAYKFCVCKCVYSQFVQCSGVLCCR